MNAGDLRFRVTVLSAEANKLPNGERTTTYRPSVRLWADVRPESAKEEIESARAATAAMWTVYFRFRPSVVSTDRLAFHFAGQSVTLDIIGITHDSKRTWTRAVCREAEQL
ncbi:MAG: head-tail adaptor protein [Planctomycetota bacterium]